MSVDSEPAAAGPTGIYFDGQTNRRRTVLITLGASLAMVDEDGVATRWALEDIRRADAPPGLLRLRAVSGAPLARLEIRDAALAAQIEQACTALDHERHDHHRHGLRIVAWSLAAVASIVLLVTVALPALANRFAPYVPPSFDRWYGRVAESQIRTAFDGKLCARPSGKAALDRLVEALGRAGALEGDVEASVIESSTANAFALPGGRVYILSGLLRRAHEPDELAGVIAHELGHVAHRDQIRAMIHDGGVSFLVGLLFGDVVGSGTILFGARSLFEASYSRDAETQADGFAIATLQALGRSPKPFGDLLLRLTGREGGNALAMFNSHPLSEARRARLAAADGPVTGAPLLSIQDWMALKTICR